MNDRIASVARAGAATRWRLYAAAIVLTAATLWLRFALSGWIGDRPMLIVFLVPIMISGYWGGIGPGLAATALAAAGASYYLMTPALRFSIARPVDFVQWLVLIVCGVLVSVLNEALHRARRRAEPAMMEREAAEEVRVHFRSIVGSSDDAIIGKNLDGIVTSWNPAAERIFGYTAGEVIGQPLLKLFPPERIGEEADIMAQIAAGKHVEHFETVRVRKDGTRIDVSVTISPIRNSAGQIVGASKIARDITAGKRTEVALRDNERRFRALIEHSTDSISVVDADNHIIYLSPSVRSVEGYAPEELIGRNGLENTHPDDLTRVEVYVRQLLAAPGESIPVLWRRRHKDGRWLWLEGYATNLLGDPVIRGIVTNYRDVTQRREAEAALRESQALYRSLVDQMPAGVFRKDAEGRYVFVNSTFCRLRNTTWDLFLGRLPAELPDIEAPFKTEAAEHHAEIMRTGRTIEVIDEYHREDGTTLYFHVVKSPVFDSDHRIIGTQGIVVDITEHRRAEEELKFHETLLREMGQIAKVGGWELDVATGARRWTEEVARIHDLDPALSSRSRLGLDDYRGTSRVRIEAALKEAVEFATPYDLELELITAKGAHKWVRTIGHPVEANGKVVKIRGSYQDITERKRAEVALHESNARFASMFKSSPVATSLSTLREGRYLDVNEAFLKMFQRSRDEVIGHTVHELNTWVDWRKRDALFAALKEHGVVHNFEMELRAKSGQVIELLWSGVQIVIDGETCLLGSGSDITERKRAQAALRESEERFRQIAGNITEVFWMTDPGTGTMLYVSPAYEAIWGRTCESLYAAPRLWLEAIHAEDRDRVRAAAEKQADGNYDESYRILRPDGSPRWIRDRAFPIRDQDGRVYRMVGTAEDITDRRRLEGQFREAQKLEAIGTLAGGIAHDFNNILTAINGFAELARLTAADNHAACEHIDSVLTATWRAASLVRQILAFSRREEQQRHPIQLDQVMAEPLKLLRATIPSIIEFDVALAPALPSVLADTTQIHQVVINLGTNAWQAMKPRAGRLQVRLEKVAVDSLAAEANPHLRPGDYVRLSVTDTGHGMDLETQAHIFEPFFTTKLPGEGTGLGLSVVHGIVVGHDGAITVYSEPGRGTTFHVYFPAHGAESVEKAAKMVEVPLGRGERVLFVDDEKPLALLGQKMLERLGYKVESISSVVAALERVRAHPRDFDLVITDLTMPVMTGTDFAAELLALRPDLPIVLTTGFNASLTSARLRELGIRELLLKPHSLQSLGAAVHRVLAESKAG
jgi:PAS domain S-box-containing protein